MFYKSFFVFLGWISLFLSTFGQDLDLVWSNPLDSGAVRGRVGTYQDADYHRLPASMEKEVRATVWRLGKQSAGMYIDFETDADTLVVRYEVSGRFGMHHMPATGVSGVDLYAFDAENQKWSWAPGQYDFADTVSYTFREFSTPHNSSYRLYLPLYNEVKWLQIGTSSGQEIKYKTATKQKPIIVYGTSIAQGACATRPGMAWTNILHRELNYPLVNLGFSGNGKLEQPILDFINRQNPAMVVLDCLPNLHLGEERTEEELKDLIDNAIKTIRSVHPEIPILLAEHSTGFNPQFLYRTFQHNAEQRILITRERIKALREQGDQNLYLLPNADFKMEEDVTVDYVHPNDVGMKNIAEAYKDMILKIQGHEK